MSLGHKHGLVLIGPAGPMDVVNLSLSLSLPSLLQFDGSAPTKLFLLYMEEEIHYVHTASKGL